MLFRSAKSLLTRQRAKQNGGTVGISNSGAAASKTPKTYDQLMGLPQRERDLIYKNNRKLWNRLMDQA